MPPISDQMDAATLQTADKILGILDAEEAAADAGETPKKKAAQQGADQQDTTTDDQAEGADDAAEADEAVEDESEADEAEDAGAQDDNAPTDDDEEEADEQDAEADDKKAKGPAIDAPVSFSAEEKAEFAKLPPAMQRTLARRESEREQKLTKSTQEAAEAIKAAIAEKAATESERQKYAAELVPLIQSMSAAFLDEFADIKTPIDLQKMAADEPDRYARFAARRDAINAARAEVTKLNEAQQADMAKRYTAHIAEQRKLLVEKWPEMADPEKGKANTARVVEDLKARGFSDDDLKMILTDHRAVLIVRDALKARDLEAAEAARQQKTAEAKKTGKAKQVKKPARAARPGNAEVKETNGARVAALKQHAIRSGKTADVAEAALAILG